MDLALNNLQRLICHKTQTTDQPTGGVITVRVQSIDQIDMIENYEIYRLCFWVTFLIYLNLWKSDNFP